MDPKQLSTSDPFVVICELCGVRIPTSRRDAKQARFDHAVDEHFVAFFAVAPADRPNYLHRMFRITNRLGRPERLPI